MEIKFKIVKRFISLAAICIVFSNILWSEYLHTIDRKMYEGKLVAFRENTLFFNVYKFGKVFETKRFPIEQVWKIEFNKPQDGLGSTFDTEQNYNKFRKGKRTRKIELNGNRNWVDTGLDVNAGQTVLFSVTGYIYIDKNNMVYQNGELNLTWNKRKPLPNMPTGALIGKVGANGQMFYIGDDKAPFQMQGTGRLFIGINDFDLNDNSGQFIVTIYF